MPKVLQYRSGSVIYFQGDSADKIFILKTGSVSLVYQDIETGAYMHDMVQPGEFFGVKSALGHYSREENAQVLQNTEIMAFTVPEFEQMATENIRIIMNMLKVFSNQMRRIHQQVSSLTKREQENPEAGLMSVGEYYLKNRRFLQAHYIFNRYLTCYPSGQFAFRAEKNLELTGAGLSGKKEAAPGGVSVPPLPDRMTAIDFAKAYYDAVSLLSQEKYQQAYGSFKKIIEAGADPEYAAKSSFEAGHCLFSLGRYDECLKHFTAMITQYPRYPDLAEALLYMGQSHEKQGQKEQAAAFYKKAVSMAGDNEAIAGKARRAAAAMGA